MIPIDDLGAWAGLRFFDTDLPGIQARLDRETRLVLPPAERVLAALALCPPDLTRVVILGQDPYPTPGHANGLAFSTAAGVTPLPKSLQNIFREMREDLGAAPSSPDLGFWADQGVLLLNTVLTTPAGLARGHRGLGWERLTGEVLGRLDDRARALILWGRDAQAEARHLARPDHLILRSPHPSPLSAHRGFFGSRPFSTVNRWLKERGEPEIDWVGTP